MKVFKYIILGVLCAFGTFGALMGLFASLSGAVQWISRHYGLSESGNSILLVCSVLFLLGTAAGLMVGITEILEESK